MLSRHSFVPSFSTAAALLITTLVVSLASCGLYSLDPVPEGAEVEEVEQVVLKIAVVPSDVRCLRITVAGPGRTVERELETAGDTTLSQSLSGLPLGTVTFLGEAFTAACSSVSKSTIAAWTSQPVQTSIVLGRLSTVELVMTRNGRAKVEITFNEEGACTTVGQACRIASECCSKKCTAQVCVTEEAAPTSSVPKIFP
jgi:hypothetical protein